MGLFWQYWETYELGTIVCLNSTVDFRYEMEKLLMDNNEETIGISGFVTGLFREDVVYNVYYADLVGHIMSVARVQ